MRAVSSDREEFVVAPDQQHFLSTNVTEQLGSVREFVLREAKGEIRSTGFGMIQHFFPFKAWAQWRTALSSASSYAATVSGDDVCT
jgi:hypothetical protein